MGRCEGIRYQDGLGIEFVGSVPKRRGTDQLEPQRASSVSQTDIRCTKGDWTQFEMSMAYRIDRVSWV